MIEAEIVIVGGGIAGCSAAFHLALHGRRVVLLERGDARKIPEMPLSCPFDRGERRPRQRRLSSIALRLRERCSLALGGLP